MTLYAYNSQMIALGGFYNRPLADIAPASSQTMVQVIDLTVEGGNVEVVVTSA